MWNYIGEVGFDMNNGKYLLIASLIFSISLIIAANLIGTEINHAGLNSTSSMDTLDEYPLANYELIVNEGWFYLYDTNSGTIWKKPAADNNDLSWEMVEHFSK